MKSVFERLEEYNSKWPSQLKAIKYNLMGQGAFRFFRGTCHLFYEDYTKHPITSDTTLSWICGDLHMENFGSYKGDNRLVYFDLNDFDEAILAPTNYELARILVSILLISAEFEIKSAVAVELCSYFMEIYMAALRGGKATDIEKETATGIMKRYFRQVEKRKQKDLIKIYAERAGDVWTIRTDSPKILPVDAKKKKEVITAVNNWLKKSHLKPLSVSKAVDVGFRIAGTGSVGIQRFVVLTVNPDNPDKSFVLDLKEAPPSCLAPYIKIEQPHWKNEAERVVSIQHRMQFVSPALLSPFELSGKQFVLKELQPMIDKMDFTACEGKPKKLKAIIRSMAQLTAFSQLRSSGRQGSSTADELITLGQRNDIKDALVKFATEYYKVVNKDFADFKKAYIPEKSKAAN